MSKFIAVGDIVKVDINCANMILCHKAIVHRIPCSTGESWHFTDCATGDKFSVSEGCTVTLINKQD